MYGQSSITVAWDEHRTSIDAAVFVLKTDTRIKLCVVINSRSAVHDGA